MIFQLSCMWLNFATRCVLLKAPKGTKTAYASALKSILKLFNLSGLTIKGWKCLLGSFCDTSNTLGGSNGIEMGLTVPISAIPFSSCSMVVFHILIAQGHREQCCSQFDVAHIVSIPVTSMVNYCNCLRNENTRSRKKVSLMCYWAVKLFISRNICL